MGGWWQDGRKVLAAAIVAATLLAAWMFRYEPVLDGTFHRNRFTGATCVFQEECWFK
jgi:hypothetical protein